MNLPASILWHVTREGFDIVGYALGTQGWHHPIVFLRERQAHLTPLPLLQR